VNLVVLTGDASVPLLSSKDVHCVDLSTYLDSAMNNLLRADLSHLSRPSDYDTSWAARLISEDGSLEYPHLIHYLTKRQNPDGSWGGRIPYAHDRLLSTLAVVLLLSRFGPRQRYHEQCSAGERYIWGHAGDLQEVLEPTAGFELILPALLEEAYELGLNLPYDALHCYGEARTEKLSILPTRRLFGTRTTALFSLEAFTGNIDVEGAASLLSNNGSMVDSPSATAWLLGQFPNWRTRFPQSAVYLEDSMSRNGGGLPVVAPCGIFLRAWVLYYLHGYGSPPSDHEARSRPHYDYLCEHWLPHGVGSSPFALRDSDDTSMVALVLHRAGYEVDGSCLLTYERDEHFAVFDHELHTSVSANLHVLEALETLPSRDRARVRDKILSYVLDVRMENGYCWRDKWHASVYFATSHALMALLPHVPDRLGDTASWLLASQRADGSWGEQVPTAEETALTLLALLHYHRAYPSLPTEPLRRAARYLLLNDLPFKDNYPELWIAKALYVPTDVVRSIIIASLSTYQDTFGDLIR
jgi:halimadienyl-diphosphate synthase